MGGPRVEKEEDDARQALSESHGMVDLSRLAPEMYLSLEKGRQALRDVAYGILKDDRNGVAIGVVVSRTDVQWEKRPRATTTVVTKVKTDGAVKSRLRLRGDRIPAVDQPFASAPTVSRDFLNIFRGFYANIGNSHCVQVDISKACTQSDMLPPKGRMVARVPDFAGLRTAKSEWHIALTAKALLFESGIPSSNPEVASSRPKLRLEFVPDPRMFGIWLNRPLYGSHDAPLRWHLAITKAMIRHQFLPLHVDKCVFAKHAVSSNPDHPLSVHGRITAALISVHVDDVVYIGDPSHLAISKKNA